MDDQPFGRLVSTQWMITAHRLKGVDAVHHMDFMPVPEQGPGQAVHIRGISSEALRPEEGCDHAKLHRRPPVAARTKSMAQVEPSEFLP